MDVRYLVYTSRLVDPAGPAAVPSIIRNARLNNATTGITGALMFDGERFCQYIEGLPHQIGRTYAAIERDRRHDSLALLASGESSSRRFARWSMAYVYAVTPELIESIAGLAGPEVADAFERALAQCDLEA